MNNTVNHEIPELEQITQLKGEVERLRNVVDALIEQAERPMTLPNNAFGLFQSTVLLEDQVRTRTAELESALRNNQRIRHELQTAKDKIEANEKILANILEYSPIGLSLINDSHHYTMVNQAFCEIVGYTREELYQLTPVDITYPEDRHLSLSHLEDLWKSKKASYQIEKRYVHKKGHPVWVRLTVSTLFDADGKPTFHIGQVEDISAQRQTEEQLRLASKVFNFSNEAMIITDPDNKIIKVNPAFTTLTGYSEPEVIGANPKILSSSRHDKKFYKDLWQKLKANGHWEGEIFNRKKNGEIFTEWLSISCIYDDNGELKNHIALFSDITEKKKAADNVLHQANYDSLTKLPNRRLFQDRLEQSIITANRTKKQFALMFIDLDYFKEVNDSFGHQFGDELLIQVANRIISKVRASDTIARIGGDEFTAIFPAVEKRADMVKIAEELNQALATPFMLGKNQAQISASIGIILYPADVSNIHDLMNGADKAMYLSKKNGRNRYTFFEKDS